jgi:GTP-binding protein EngB required for normal cell division
MTEASPGVREAARPQLDPDLKKAMDAARGVLVANGLNDVAERAWAHLVTPGGAPAVVVIGEVKRGKSSLVNALLARPNASTVDVDIATSAFVRFVPPTESRPAGETTLLFAGGRRQSVKYSELADWVTMSGQHVNDPTVEELPIGAEVAIASPFLPTVTLVDTPGVGGLNPSHLRLARTATTTASVLVMTCDATAPITAPEMEFLESVSAEVNSVIIAVTKIDKNFRHWKSIFDENRRLLRQHSPRFADVPMVGVSSVAAVSAFKMEAGDRRKAALRASGFSEMVAQLHRSCAQGDTLAAANGLRAARSGLERVATQLDLRRSAMIGGQSATAALNGEKERLQSLRHEWEGGWRDYLARDLGAVQRNTLAALDHRLDALKSQWRKKLDETKLDLLRRSPQLFVADMTADLEALVTEVSDEYIGAVNHLVNGLKINAEVSVPTFTSGIREVERPRKRGEGVIDPSMMSAATTGISTLGMGLVSVLAVGTVVAIPLVAAIGGTWIAVNYGFRAIKMGRQGLQQWLNLTVTAVAKDVSREIQERGEAIRPVIINEYKQYLTDSMTELKNLLVAAEAAEKSSRAERADAVAELDTKRKSLQATIAGIDAQLAKMMRSNPSARQ